MVEVAIWTTADYYVVSCRVPSFLCMNTSFNLFFALQPLFEITWNQRLCFNLCKKVKSPWNFIQDPANTDIQRFSTLAKNIRLPAMLSSLLIRKLWAMTSSFVVFLIIICKSGMGIPCERHHHMRLSKYGATLSEGFLWSRPFIHVGHCRPM